MGVPNKRKKSMFAYFVQRKLSTRSPPISEDAADAMADESLLLHPNIPYQPHDQDMLSPNPRDNGPFSPSIVVTPDDGNPPPDFRKAAALSYTLSKAPMMELVNNQ